MTKKKKEKKLEKKKKINAIKNSEQLKNTAATQQFYINSKRKNMLPGLFK